MEKLIIDLTMSNRIQFLLSVTTFCCGVSEVLSCDKISCSLRKETNSIDMYSPLRLQQSDLTCLPNCFSYSALNSLNLSKLSDFSSLGTHIHILSSR